MARAKTKDTLERTPRFMRKALKGDHASHRQVYDEGTASPNPPAAPTADVETLRAALAAAGEVNRQLTEALRAQSDATRVIRRDARERARYTPRPLPHIAPFGGALTHNLVPVEPPPNPAWSLFLIYGQTPGGIDVNVLVENRDPRAAFILAGGPIPELLSLDAVTIVNCGPRSKAFDPKTNTFTIPKAIAKRLK